MEVYNPIVDTHLTKADTIVLKNLFNDIREVSPSTSAKTNGSTNSHTTGSTARGTANGLKTKSTGFKSANGLINSLKGSTNGKLVSGSSTTTILLDREDRVDDAATVKTLEALSDPSKAAFEPTVYNAWDANTVPSFLQGVTDTYTRLATPLLRRPTDIVFLTHILIYATTSLPSAILLYYHFTYPHAILHHLMTTWHAGAFTLMLHNHIHNNGILARNWWLLDVTFPYVLSPLMGHTWNSYYYHHVKHHHVEGNGPGDLSSTVRYQRDELVDFLHYVGRFLLFAWIELPYYFYRKGKYGLAVRSFVTEATCYTLIVMMLRWRTAPSVSVLALPLLQMRIGMMVGNWGQHALVDEVDPKSDFRSSITLIDVPSNRYCFNDGYHTSHHLNPRRHWRDHPAHFIKSKSLYASNSALVFKDTDYIMMTVRLLRKDYRGLAKCFVPLGEEQCKMTEEEVMEMLKRKTRRFDEAEVVAKWGKSD